ncbi:MAG: ATP-binding cassette domain-containing protein [Azospirillum sp.]|nr:ATP-binding cassette domain-containing protein [Azospirillum sp.]
MTAAVAVRGLCKAYKLYASPGERLKEAVHPMGKQFHREFLALSDLSFTVPPGHTIGILGQNGSGKSTLLGILSGTMPPTRGEVSVRGRIVALLELGTGFDPTMTGRENVMLYGAIHGVGAEEMRSRIPEIEAFADIGGFFDLPVKIYSSGMFARLAFAAAIRSDPDVLIIDEILSVGDARFQEKCFHRIRQMQQSGTTILFVSHSTDQVLRLCQSAILLDGGRLACQGEAQRVVDAYHAIVYGAGSRAPAATEAGLPSVAPTPAFDPAVEAPPEALRAFAASPRPLLPDQPYYNKEERRLTNGMAQLNDILVAADGRFDFTALSGTESLTFYLKVTYRDAQHRPHLGWAVTSREGLLISGSNTLLYNVTLPAAQAGECCLYAINFRLNLNAGDYFVNLGINADLREWTFLDVRRAVIHLAVHGAHRCTGFIDTPTTFVRISAVPSIPAA